VSPPERKIDFSDFPEDERDFSAHRDKHWLDKAINPRHPLALRVYFVALGRRKVGGHAPLDAGELGELLVSPGAKIPDRRRISEAIGTCVHWGYLGEGSNALCLVVPLEDVRGGRGAQYRCRRKHKKGSGQAHAEGCPCARCQRVGVDKVSAPERTPDPKVSGSDVDTSSSSVRSDTDTLSGGPLFSLHTATHDHAAPEVSA
jgi:hypothetical protein